MKPILLILTVCFFVSPLFGFSNSDNYLTSIELEEDNSFNLKAFEVRQRLDDISGAVNLKYNADVERNIKRYLRGRKRTISTLVGKSELYFPIFEHYLHINDLPDELKYLSIVESNLNPTANSYVGASGLWQFMKGTGRDYGLKIDSYIDERNDVIKSTEAAFRYLSSLHRRYKDWTLALAAYNCGPGRINRAIRQSGSMDFWKLRSYLPTETQNYIPAFIAAVYMMNYYGDHQVKPHNAEYEFDKIRTTTIFEASSFYEISKMSNVDFQEIKKLNPAYKRHFIPKSKHGNYLTLPVVGMMNYKDKKRMAKLNKFYQTPNTTYNEYMNIPEGMMESKYVVQKGERLDYVARLLKCDVNDLMRWNKLESPIAFFGQELLVYLPKPKPALPSAKDVFAEQEDKTTAPKKVLYHYIQKGETLDQINQFYPEVTLSDIIVRNNLQGVIVLKVGDKLKIRDL